jgi:hypothetical protein
MSGGSESQPRCTFLAALAALLASATAWAGPPFVSDDPEPTDYQHYEIYLFAEGTNGQSGSSAAGGLDFNYGAAENLQLTAVVPLEYDHPAGAGSNTGIGNIELAAKYRFVRDAAGWDVAVFPRVFLPSASSRVGDQHVSLLLPLWFEHDWDKWSTFGGAGCEIIHGHESKNFCIAGWVVTHQLRPNLQLGAEVATQTADTKNGKSSTRLGAGLRYDLNDHYHLLAYAGPGLQNVAQTGRYTWYASVLWTF